MKVSIGDVGLWFDVHGQKLVADGPKLVERPTLVLLHGGPGFDHSYFKPKFSRYAEIGQVVAYDHRANGRSDAGDPERWTLEQWGDDVATFCDVLGIEKPVVIGNSFGGMVAIAYATRHPAHPGKLVLDSTSARMDDEAMFAVFERLGGDRAAEVARKFWSNPSPETVGEYGEVCMPLYTRRGAAAMTEMMEMQARAIVNMQVLEHFAKNLHPTFDFSADLGRISCPTIVLAGEDDPVCPLAGSKAIASGIGSNARLVTFAGGHGMGDEQEDDFFALLAEFVGG
jgi:pimeloyl-ACP methyl ester carboxylesterase